MTIESQLSEKLRKIEALFAGAGTAGERLAAEAALERVRARLAELGRQDPPIEMQFTMPDRWSRHLFLALCRRYGLAPYRYHRVSPTIPSTASPNCCPGTSALHRRSVLQPDFCRQFGGRAASGTTRFGTRYH